MSTRYVNYIQTSLDWDNLGISVQTFVQNVTESEITVIDI